MESISSCEEGVDNPCQSASGSESQLCRGPLSFSCVNRSIRSSRLPDFCNTSSPAMLKNLQAEYMTLTANHYLHGVGNVPRPSLRRQNSCTKRPGSNTTELRE